MRYKLDKGKQREMLLFAKTKLGLSWVDFANKLEIGYTTLKECRNERWSIKDDVFDKVTVLCPECKSFNKYIIKIEDDNWGRLLGGLHTKERKHGFLDPKYANQNRIWKSTGGKIGTRKWHEQMKKEKPLEYRQIQYSKIKQSLKYRYEYEGQKYRNLLELETAKILLTNNIPFEYEKLLRCGESFYFPDFTLYGTIVECTYWPKVEEKASELERKIVAYHTLGFKSVIIITTQKYLNEYSSRIINSDVMVITLDNLSGLLDGKFGRVKRA